MQAMNTEAPMTQAEAVTPELINAVWPCNADGFPKRIVDTNDARELILAVLKALYTPPTEGEIAGIKKRHLIDEATRVSAANDMTFEAWAELVASDAHKDRATLLAALDAKEQAEREKSDAYDRFVAICENPPPPTQALIDLMRKTPLWANDPRRHAVGVTREQISDCIRSHNRHADLLNALVALLTPAQPEAMRSETRCDSCGGDNPVWFAQNDLWNRVVGSPNGFLCPVCFIKKAEGQGLSQYAWELSIEEAPTPDAAPLPDEIAGIKNHFDNWVEPHADSGGRYSQKNGTTLVRYVSTLLRAYEALWAECARLKNDLEEMTGRNFLNANALRLHKEQPPTPTGGA